jgi:hypothetical protein
MCSCVTENAIMQVVVIILFLGTSAVRGGAPKQNMTPSASDLVLYKV